MSTEVGVDDAAAEAGVRIHRVDAVGSTQDVAASRWRAGESAPFAVAAREQTSGRGRLGRPFVSPPGGAFALTFAHRTAVPPTARTWFPLAAGLAAIEALGASTGVDRAGGAGGDPAALGLKWPNDIQLADGRKLGGILLEGCGTDGVLIGIGLNLRGPIRDGNGATVPGAAWLLGPGGILPSAAMAEDAQVDALREVLVARLTAELVRELGALESSGGDAAVAGTRQRYTMTCLTVGQAVRVDPLGGSVTDDDDAPLRGTACDVDAHGRLVLALPGGDRVPVDVGDVRHLRPSASARPTTGAAGGAEQEDHEE